MGNWQAGDSPTTVVIESGDSTAIAPILTGDSGASTVIESGDQNVSSGECFLLREDGGFVLLENYCKIIIHDNHIASWKGGDTVQSQSTDSEGNCLPPTSNIGTWETGD